MELRTPGPLPWTSRTWAIIETRLGQGEGVERGYGPSMRVHDAIVAHDARPALVCFHVTLTRRPARNMNYCIQTFPCVRKIIVSCTVSNGCDWG